MQLRQLMDRGADWGYFPNPNKSIFISGNLEEKEVARRELKRVGLHLTYLDGSRYLGSYLGPREELEALGADQG